MSAIPACLTDPASLAADNSRETIPMGAEVTVTVTHKGTGMRQWCETAPRAMASSDVRRDAIARYCREVTGNPSNYSATVRWTIPGLPVDVYDTVRRLYAYAQR